MLTRFTTYKKLSWQALCALLLCFPYLAYAASARVSGFHAASAAGKTHVTIELTGATDYKVFTLANPNRLVIDFPEARLATSLHANFNKTPVLAARSGYPSPDTLRIVLDLRKLVRHTVNLQKSNSNKAYLSIDLIDPNYHPPVIKKEKKTKSEVVLSAPQALTAASPLPTSSAQQTINTPPKAAARLATTDENSQIEQDMLQQVLARQNQQNMKQSATSTETAQTGAAVAITSLAIPPLATAANALPAPIATANSQRVINIVIDPGHGGKDPGTTGHFGVREKDVVLAIGSNLYQLLRKDPRFHVVMTRSSDYFLTLRQRLNVARQNHSDVFIAIHADAFKDPFATGVSIYALSPHGASSEAALWLARKENYSELGGIKLNDKSDLLRSVLIDLSQTATVSSSLQLGQDLLDELSKLGKLHHNFVEQAPFMVLKSPDIPSVLIETGFLSNPSEEERLRNPIYQQQLGQAVYAGLLDYFTTNPAAGKQIVTAKK